MILCAIVMKGLLEEIVMNIWAIPALPIHVKMAEHAIQCLMIIHVLVQLLILLQTVQNY